MHSINEHQGWSDEEQCHIAFSQRDQTRITGLDFCNLFLVADMRNFLPFLCLGVALILAYNVDAKSVKKGECNWISVSLSRFGP